MELFIIRHAQATYILRNGSDIDRNLTDAGILQAVKLAKSLKDKNLKPDLILSSPYKRALETARILSEYTHCHHLKTVEWLGCGMLPTTALDSLKPHFSEHNRIAIVGHQPDLSTLIEHLDQHSHLASVPVASLHIFQGELNQAGGRVTSYPV